MKPTLEMVTACKDKVKIQDQEPEKIVHVAQA